MAEPGPTEVAPSGQGALREEDDVWAVDDGGENRVLSEPVLAAAGRALRPSLLLSCACSVMTEGPSSEALRHTQSGRLHSWRRFRGRGCQAVVSAVEPIACSKYPAPRFTLKTPRGDGSVYSGTWTRKEGRCENAQPMLSRDDQRRPCSQTPWLPSRLGSRAGQGSREAWNPKFPFQTGCYRVNKLAGAMMGTLPRHADESGVSVRQRL